MVFLELHQYKAIALLIGIEEAGVPLPLPGDLAIVIMGVQVSAGKASPIPVVAVTAASATAGASLLYWISRLLGTRILKRYGRALHLTTQRQQWVEHKFNRYGAPVIIVGRLIPGLRIAVAVAAGIAKVQFSRFVIYTAISATIWASMFMFIGWAIGDTWEEDRGAIVGAINNPLSLLGLGIIVGSAVTVWIYRRKVGKLRNKRQIPLDNDKNPWDESTGMGD